MAFSATRRLAEHISLEHEVATKILKLLHTESPKSMIKSSFFFFVLLATFPHLFVGHLRQVARISLGNRDGASKQCSNNMATFTLHVRNISVCKMESINPLWHMARSLNAYLWIFIAFDYLSAFSSCSRSRCWMFPCFVAVGT